MGDPPVEPDPAALERALEESFGLPAFREGQRDVIDTVLRGEDVLVVRPTGSGKSLCYQLPAILLPGVTLVVSPLIALMKDQRDALAARGIPAVTIHSGMSLDEQREAVGALRRGDARLCYVAPERFRVPRFVEALTSLRVSLLAIDEAHCVSEWGHEFRPDYRRLSEARRALGRPPVIALTATATARVRRDILDELDIPEANVFVSGFDRPNLHFAVEKITSPLEKLDAVKELLSEIEPDGAAIIYCATRRHAEELAKGLGATLYHAGLPPEERAQAQEAFMAGDARVLVATNAFGMGIDRPDIRLVVHAEMPRSLEAYYQEAGRAGRDGLDARCVLLYSYRDRFVHEFLIDESTPTGEFVAEVWRALEPERGPGPRPDLDIQRLAEVVAERQAETGEGGGRRARGRSRDRGSSSGERDGWGGSGAGAGGGRGRRPSRRAPRQPRPRTLAVESALKLLEKAGHVVLPRDRRQPLEVAEAVLSVDLDIDWTALEARRNHEHSRLEQMLRYAQSHQCRTREILRHFGDRSPASFQGRCGHCDACAEAPDLPAAIARGKALAAAAPPLLTGAEGAPTVARKVLAGVARMVPAPLRSEVAACLAGCAAARGLEQGHDRLSTYGILRALPRDGLVAWLDALARAGLLARAGGRVTLTSAGVEVMAGRAALPPLPGLAAGAATAPAAGGAALTPVAATAAGSGPSVKTDPRPRAPASGAIA